MKMVNGIDQKIDYRYTGSPEHLFFTSDTHFSHKNIIDFCGRPYSCVEDMNESLIENWNSVIGKDDKVYHLGDFCFGGSYEWHSVLDRLNGNITLILGNHDMKNYRNSYADMFDGVYQQLQIEAFGKTIYLNHFPFLCFGGAYRENGNVWALHGHTHFGSNNSGKDIERLKMCFPTQYDVGVDANEYKPISFSQIEDKISHQIKLNKNQYFSSTDEINS